jgi:hypothetical protein
MKIIYIVVLLVIVFFAGFFLRTGFTGKAVIDVNNKYSYTRALCNSENECMDLLVSCENGNVASIVAGSKVVKQLDGWQDPRNLSEKLC